MSLIREIYFKSAIRKESAMRNSLFRTAATTLAALTVGVCLAATPVLAATRHGGGGGHHVAAGAFHRGGGHYGGRYAGHSYGGGGYGGGYYGGGYYGGCYDQGFYGQGCGPGPGIVGGVNGGAMGAILNH